MRTHESRSICALQQRQGLALDEWHNQIDHDVKKLLKNNWEWLTGVMPSLLSSESNDASAEAMSSTTLQWSCTAAR